MRAATRAIALLAALLGAAQAASAAEIKALITTTMQPAVALLVPQFERATGHKVSVGYGAPDALSLRLQKREFADMIVIGRGEMVLLIKEGKVRESFDVARTGFGIGVKRGAPRPDVSTPDALKKTLLAATSIGQPSLAGGGLAALHVQRVLAQLGIREQVSGKLKFAPNGKVGALIAGGSAEIAIQQLPDLMSNPGVEVVGLLPDKLQLFTDNAAGITAATKQPDAVRALIRHLTSAEAKAVYRAKGLDL
jgi:molybdate transport system substrate-binding protein